jgi:hypothetical protein
MDDDVGGNMFEEVSGGIALDTFGDEYGGAVGEADGGAARGGGEDGEEEAGPGLLDVAEGEEDVFPSEDKDDADEDGEGDEEEEIEDVEQLAFPKRA